MIFLFNWVAKLIYGEDYDKHVNKPIRRPKRRR